MPSDIANTSNKRLRLPVAVLLVVSAIVGVGGVVLVAHFIQEVRKGGPLHVAYLREIEDAKKAGVPVTPQLLQAPLPPEEQNAAPIYTQLTELLEAHPLSKQDEIADETGSRSMPSSEQFDRIRTALRRRSGVMKLIHEAAARPECVFTKDWSDPINVQFKEFATIHRACRLLESESMVLAHDGKPIEAVRNASLGFSMARHVGNENLLMADLVAVAADAITINTLQKMLYITHGDATVADAVLAAMQTQPTEHDLAGTIRTEAGSHVVELEVLRKQGPATLTAFLGDNSAKPMRMPPGRWNNFIDENGSVLLARERQAIAAVGTPYTRSAPAIRAVDAEVDAGRNPMHLIDAVLSMSYENTVNKQAQSRDIADTTRAGAALLGYRGKHGEFPATLGEVMTPVPNDPFTDKPLQYSREGKGFVVYSVGPDGKFDGGEPGKVKRRYDVLFRYPLPSYYAKALKE